MPYDRGDLDGPAYWALLARDGGCRMSELQVSQLIEVDSQSWARLNDSTLKWVERMAASGIRLGLLSNMPLEISRYLKQNARWPEMFDSLVYSCDVREVKPDPAIYAYSLKALDSWPEDVLFVDDRTENLEAASQLGIHTLLFDSVEDASRRAGEQFALPLAGN
jgi:putative hydrolase of the HAD superfamily